MGDQFKSENDNDKVSNHHQVTAVLSVVSFSHFTQTSYGGFVVGHAVVLEPGDKTAGKGAALAAVFQLLFLDAALPYLTVITPDDIVRPMTSAAFEPVCAGVFIAIRLPLAGEFFRGFRIRCSVINGTFSTR